MYFYHDNCFMVAITTIHEIYYIIVTKLASGVNEDSNLAFDGHRIYKFMLSDSHGVYLEKNIYEFILKKMQLDNFEY